MPRRTKRKRRPLSRHAIVRAATRLVDHRGSESLTMRALAKELHVEAMSLYSHFHNKNDLIDSVTASVLNGLELPLTSMSPSRRLAVLADRIRHLGHKHPNVFPLIILRPQRLEPTLRLTEAALAAFLDAGLSTVLAIRAQRTLLGFVRGYTMWEIGGFAVGRRHGPGGRPKASVVGELRGLDAAAFPRAIAAADALVRFNPDDDFHAGVRVILKGLLTTTSGKRA